jgi:hypothetical protein
MATTAATTTLTTCPMGSNRPAEPDYHSGKRRARAVPSDAKGPTAASDPESNDHGRWWWICSVSHWKNASCYFQPPTTTTGVWQNPWSGQAAAVERCRCLPPCCDALSFAKKVSTDHPRKLRKTAPNSVVVRAACWCVVEPGCRNGIAPVLLGPNKNTDLIFGPSNINGW